MFSGTLSDTAQDALALLGESGLLSSSYLAGGSSLALQLGHRLSVDFDFFSQEKFDALEIKRKLERLGEYKSDELTKNTLLGIFEGVSFSLFHYPYKLIRPTQKFAKIDLALSSLSLESFLRFNTSLFSGLICSQDIFSS